jgi:hypothetical protein
MDIQFATQSYISDTLPLSAQRCVNFYAEAQPRGAKSPVAVFGCPGIETFATLGTGPVRGMRVFDNVLHVLSGGTFYRVDEDKTVTALGGTIAGTDIVSIDDNGTDIAIVNGSNGFLYNATLGFRLITDPDFQAANTVSFIDSFLAFDQAGTNKWFISGASDAASYNALAFGSAETRSDDVLAVGNHLQIVYVFGTETTELFGNTGAANFPFQRIPGGTIDRGIAGPHAKTAEDQAIYILGNDRIAYRVSGTTLARISTHALEKHWERFSTVADLNCFSYTFGGHKFIVFNFVAANETWVYDIATRLWHERSSRDENLHALGRWCGNCSANAYGKTFIGSQFSGKIGYIDDRIYTEFGNQIVGELVSPPLHAAGKRMFMPWFELDVENGVGLTSGQGSDPQIMLSISDDGARTFSSQEPWRSMGKIGEYGDAFQLRWDRLGSFYQRAIKVTVSDPVRRCIIAARAPELSVGL